MAHISDNSKPLDSRLTFANADIQKTDYVSKQLPYAIGEGDISAWDELLSTLYSPVERAKIEWAIGSIVAGDSKKIQKFIVFYGPPGTGKSTILNIIGQLFEGYCTSFDGKALGSSNSAFATEVFKHNPLVAIQHGLLDEEVVCPGDYIITDRNGYFSRLSRGEFESHYEPYVRVPSYAKQPLSDLEQRKQSRKRREESV